jgi:hypothetical protein
MSVTAKDKWIISLPTKYSPHFYKPKRILQNFLREKHLLNETDCNLTGEEIELLALDENFVSDETPAGHRLTECVTDYVLKLNNTVYFSSDLCQKKKSVTSKTTIKGRVISLLKRLEPSTKHSGKWRAPWLNWSHDPVCLKMLHNLDDALCKKKNRLRSNATGRLPIPLRKAISSLRDNNKFFVCKADKGGATVLWSREGYTRESMRHLNDESTYAQVFPVNECADQVRKLLQGLKSDRIQWMHFLGLITDAEKERILSTESENKEKIPHIYFSAKIHKPKRQDSGTWEGRPIVATYNGPLHWLDKYLAELTKTIMPLIPLSLTSTTEFLNNLEPGLNCSFAEDNLPTNNVRIFTADARSLFTSIPWSDSTEAAVETYTEHYSMLADQALATGMCKPPNPSVFKILLMTILENSYVQYQNQSVFHQIKGTAMGACISVFLAKCYMYRACAVPLLLNPPSHLSMLQMYIDDVFFVTKTTAAEGDGPLDDIVNSMSTQHVSFERTEASSSCDFLDLTITVNSLGGFTTKPFTKPFCNPCLPYYRTAGQNKNARAGVAYGEFLRIRRNSTYTRDFLDASVLLKRRLSSRGFPRQVIDDSFEKALKKSRFELLSTKKTICCDSKSQNIRLIVPYGHGREFQRARFIMRRLDARIRRLHQLDNKWKSTIVFRKQRPIGASWTAPFKFGCL